MKRLIVITGATACGKTSVSVLIAKKLCTEIISCDSRQFYKEMSIGTAKPTLEEMDGVIHHFINSHSITEELNAGQFEKLALPLLDKLFTTHDQVILTGGSGLFIDAVLNGFDTMPNVAIEVREELNTRLNNIGIASLFKQLNELDPQYAKIVDQDNPKRIIRALEVCISSGKTYTEFRKGQTAKRNFETLKIVLDRPREELYDRINRRVDNMMQAGLLKEVKTLITFQNINALQTVGYRELFAYLNDEYSLERAIELIKQNSRRYAKRQLTWFRRSDDYQWVDANDFDTILSLTNQ